MLNVLKAVKLRVVSSSLKFLLGVSKIALGLRDGRGDGEDGQDREIRGEILFDYCGYFFVGGVLVDCTIIMS